VDGGEELSSSDALQFQSQANSILSREGDESWICLTARRTGVVALDPVVIDATPSKASEHQLMSTEGAAICEVRV
jgi:hypothetical protein